MRLREAQPSLAEQVRDAILGEIAEGRLAPGARIIQEQVAQELGVSRQPVQQALLLLRDQGVLRDAPGRGLLVAPLDLDYVRDMYDMRAVIEGLAARRAAEVGAQEAAERGPGLIRAGREAIAGGSLRGMIAADMDFHQFIYGLSQNGFVAPAMATHWSCAQRVMGEVLTRDEPPHDIWDQHEALLGAIVSGDGTRAELLAREHIVKAAVVMLRRLTTSPRAP